MIIIDNYSKRKEFGAVNLLPKNEQVVISSVRIFDPTTGEFLTEITSEISIPDIERQKIYLQEQLNDINLLLEDIANL